jgi:hypothetical protein
MSSLVENSNTWRGNSNDDGVLSIPPPPFSSNGKRAYPLAGLQMMSRHEAPTQQKTKVNEFSYNLMNYVHAYHFFFFLIVSVCCLLDPMWRIFVDKSTSTISSNQSLRCISRIRQTNE